MSVYYFTVTILAVALIVRAVIALARKQSARQVVVAATTALLVCSAAIGYFAFSHLSQLRAMRDWPTVAGTVIESRIVGEKAIVPYVVYSYDVNSAPFLGTSDLGTPAFGNKSKRLNEAETLLAEYPVGKQVVVHYDAIDPKQSYIVSAVPWNAYAQAGIWMFLALTATVVFLMFGFRKKISINALA